jgi:hypothetical protein
VRNQGQQGADLPQTQHDRAFLGVPRAHEVEDRPRALQRALVEDPKPVEMNPAGALGDPLLLEHEEEIWAQLLGAALVRRALVVVRQLADRVEIALVGRGGQAPPLQVFAHPASKAGHGHPPIRVESELSTGQHAQEDRGRLRVREEEKAGGTSGDSLEAYRAAVSFNRRLDPHFAQGSWEGYVETFPPIIWKGDITTPTQLKNSRAEADSRSEKCDLMSRL